MTTPEPVDEDAVRDALRAAVEGALSRFGELPTKWVLVAEALGSDNERGLWTTCSEGAKPWETLGLLAFVDALTRSKIARDQDL